MTEMHVFFFLFFLYRYGPFSLALSSLTIDAHSSLSNTFVLHRFTPSILKSSSTPFIHLSLGRPLPLPPSTRVGTLIVVTIYLQLIQYRYMFRSFTVLQCSHQHCVQPVASDVKIVGYL